MNLPARILRSAFASCLLIHAACGIASDLSHHLIAEQRLVSIETAAPQILLLVFIANDDAPPPSQKQTDYRINGVAPLQVGRYSATLYEER
jgi:hypothetical protein